MKIFQLFLIINVLLNLVNAQIVTNPQSPSESERNFVIQKDNSIYSSNDSSEIFSLVENMPVWYDCDQNTEELRMKCTFNKIQEFLAKNVRYPTFPKNKGIMGTVYVTFIINEFGEVSEPRVLRGVHVDLDYEALRVISKMPRWNPGIQKGEAVKVQYNIPIRFTLR